MEQYPGIATIARQIARQTEAVPAICEPLETTDHQLLKQVMQQRLYYAVQETRLFVTKEALDGRIALPDRLTTNDVIERIWKAKQRKTPTNQMHWYTRSDIAEPDQRTLYSRPITAARLGPVSWIYNPDMESIVDYAGFEKAIHTPVAAVYPIQVTEYQGIQAPEGLNCTIYMPIAFTDTGKKTVLVHSLHRQWDNAALAALRIDAQVTYDKALGALQRQQRRAMRPMPLNPGTSRKKW